MDIGGDYTDQLEGGGLDYGGQDYWVDNYGGETPGYYREAGDRQGEGEGAWEGEVMTYNKNSVKRIGGTAGYYQLNEKMVP